MDLFGTTRSHVRRSHALIAPDSFVSSELPGWERSRGVTLIAPDIVEAVLAGRQPSTLQLEDLLKPLPAAWPQQRSMLSNQR